MSLIARAGAVLLTMACSRPPEPPPASDAPEPASDAPAQVRPPVRSWIEDPPAEVPHVVILGVAQDAGHPQAGCDKDCCARAHADPAARHRVVSLGIVDGEHRVLIEATPDLPSQLRELSPSGRLDGVLLTHAHIGHYAGLVHLGREAMGADAVPVWAMPRMRRFLASDRPWSLLVEQGHIALRDLADLQAVQVTPNVTVMPFVVPHRDEVSETVGFRIDGPAFTVVFLPDIDKWERWDAVGGSIEGLVEAADVALVDGTFYADGEIPRDMAEIPHPFVSESLARFADLPPALRQRIWFTHFNHSNPLLIDPEARRAVREAGFGVAEEGRRIALGAVPEDDGEDDGAP